MSDLIRLCPEQVPVLVKIARFQVASRDEAQKLLTAVFVDGLSVPEAAELSGTPIKRSYAQLAKTREKLELIRSVGTGLPLNERQFQAAAELAYIRSDQPTRLVLEDVFLRDLTSYRAALDRGMHPANAASALARFRKQLYEIFEFNKLGRPNGSPIRRTVIN